MLDTINYIEKLNISYIIISFLHDIQALAFLNTALLFSFVSIKKKK